MPTPTSDTLFQGDHRGTPNPADPNLFSLADMAAAMGTDSLAISTATSKVISTAAASALDSAPVSTASSKASSAASQASIADSKAVSTSVPTSVADSKAVSVSRNTSVADSKAVSLDNALIIPVVNSLPGFIQPLTAATIRTANAKMADFVSVKDFGALGDGLTDDAASITAAIVAASALGTGGGRVDFPPGNYRVGSTINLLSNVTLRGVPGGQVDGGAPYGSVRLSWYGATSATVLRCFNTEFAGVDGIVVDARAIAGVTGILIDSNNSPPSHHNRFENFAVYNAAVGVAIGTSGVTGYQSDMLALRHFKIYNCTSAYIRINSQNAAQNSIIEQGHFSHAVADAVSMIELLYCPNLLTIRSCTFGSPAGYTGAAIYHNQPATSGGSPLIIENCGFELNPSGKAYYAPAGADDLSGGTLLLIGNSFSGAIVQIDAVRNVFSMGNFFASTNAQINTATAKLVSIMDVWTSGAWTSSGNAPIHIMDGSEGRNRQVIDGWYESTVAASQSNTQMTRAVPNFVAMRSGYITAWAGKSTNGVLAAGAAVTIGVGVNGSLQGTTDMAVGQTYGSATVARGTIPVVAGDRISMFITTPSGWTATTMTLAGTVQIED